MHSGLGTTRKGRKGRLQICWRPLQGRPSFGLITNQVLSFYLITDPINRHAYGFGYDSITDDYKVVVISFYIMLNDDVTDKTEVKVNTLGTNFWKNKQEFPFSTSDCIASRKFVSGTINRLGGEYHTLCAPQVSR
jgi:hypothetical protein